MMEELCTSCLCAGRKLHYIFDTKFHELYIKILEEIAPLSPKLCVTICWECRSVLNKFLNFKQQAQNSYVELMKHVEESIQPAPKQPRFTTQHIFDINCLDVKSELFDNELTNDPSYSNCVQFRNVTIVNMIRLENDEIKNSGCCVKSEGEDHFEETFVSDIVAPKRRVRKVKKKSKQKETATDKEDSDSESVPLNKYKEIYTSTSKTNDEITKTETKSNNIKLEHTDAYIDLDYLDGTSNHSDDINIIDIGGKDVNIDISKISEKGSELKKCGKKIRLQKNKHYIKTDISVEEMESQRQTDRQHKSFVNAKYKCDSCVVWFHNRSSYEQHVKLKHDPSIGDFKCPVCHTTTTNFDSFTAHYNKHMKGYQCQLCQTKTANVQMMHKHFIIAHKTKEYKCKECDKTFENNESYKYHVQTHKGRLQCDLCDKTFTHRSGLAAHFNSHKSRQFTCQFCPKTFQWKASVHRHTQRHHNTHTRALTHAQCSLCNIQFASVASYKRHLVTSLSHVSEQDFNSHKSRQFTCQFCPKTFQWKASVHRHTQRHHNTHTRALTHAQCSLCNIQFASVASYKRHLVTSLSHVSEQDFKYICNDCNKRFVNKTKLRNHIEEKHLHKTYICNVCTKSFKNYVNLDQHVRNVHKGRPNNKICHHCGKGFPTRTQLESHIRTHTGERPFICEFCPTTFSQQSNLYKHNRQVHLNIKAKKIVNEESKRNTEKSVTVKNINYFNVVHT